MNDRWNRWNTGGIHRYVTGGTTFREFHTSTRSTGGQNTVGIGSGGSEPAPDSHDACRGTTSPPAPPVVANGTAPRMKRKRSAKEGAVKPPVLVAEPAGPGRVKVWCPHCAVFHVHGSGGSRGHVLGHCVRPDSPYLRIGYVIALSKGDQA